MAGDTWVISDTHINHRNILGFRDHVTGALIRPGFDSIEEMRREVLRKKRTCNQNLYVDAHA